MRALRVVDGGTGEVVEGECPTCQEWARKYHGVMTQLGQLRADKQAEAEADALWPLAVRLFAYHNRVTKHPRARWTPERFQMVRRILKDSGLEDCLRAIAGLAADPWRVSKGMTMWEDVFESQKKFERCLAKCPANWKLPRGAEQKKPPPAFGSAPTGVDISTRRDSLAADETNQRGEHSGLTDVAQAAPPLTPNQNKLLGEVPGVQKVGM